VLFRSLDKWIKGCQEIGIPVREEHVDKVLKLEPELTPNTKRAFWLPDGVLEGFEMMRLMVQAIESHQGKVLTKTRVEKVNLSQGTVQSVVISQENGTTQTLSCDALINCSGPWAGEVSKLFDDPIPMKLSAGTMLAFAHRQVDHVISRLRKPGDGDCMVPHQSIGIFGATDLPQPTPESPKPSRNQVIELMDLGRELFPNIDQWRSLRAFTGVRPLYQPHKEVKDPRLVSRHFSVIDHGREKGPNGVFSVVGGKWSTFRLMAEKVCDIVTKYLQINISCKTHETSLEIKSEGSHQRICHDKSTVLCECESVTEGDIRCHAGSTLNELRLKTWFSMGPCQGTFCMHRVASVRATETTTEIVNSEVRKLREEREKGLGPVIWGASAKEWSLQRALRLQTLVEGGVDNE
jgi:glycerol-3-phosphate dehydrogenase